MLREQIQSLVAQAVEAAIANQAIPAVPVPDVEISRPKANFGDYSSNMALLLAAAVQRETGQKSNPRQLAQALVDHWPASDLVEKVEIAGPGFINLHLRLGWIQEQARVIVHSGSNFAKAQQPKGLRWQVEYVSANPTGPLHFGTTRNAVLGDTLANVLEAAGYEVQREYYVNDAGSQLNIFGETLYARYAQELGQDMEVPENGYLGAYMLDYVKTLVQNHGRRFLEMPRAQAIEELKTIGRQMVLDHIAADLALLGVHHDHWFSEQSLYDDGIYQEAFAILQKNGEITERDGAVWFQATHYPPNQKDEVIIRSTGSPTYFASDIAYHYDKFIRRGFDKVVDVWAVDHQGHVPRMAAVLQALGIDPNRLTILLYDLVKLKRGGQEVKMSKRSGEMISLREVVEEVGKDAVRFMLLTRSPEHTIDFDLEQAVAESDKNPVYYVQYSHARIASIMRKAQETGVPLGEPASVDVSLLTHPAELALIKQMLELEQEIAQSVEILSPHNLTVYAQELGSSFSAFYRDCKAVDPQNLPLSQARLLLCQAAKVALARVLTIMGMSAPESM